MRTVRERGNIGDHGSKARGPGGRVECVVAVSMIPQKRRKGGLSVLGSERVCLDQREDGVVLPLPLGYVNVPYVVVSIPTAANHLVETDGSREGLNTRKQQSAK